MILLQYLQYHVIQQATLAAFQTNALVHCLTHGQNQLKLVTVYRLILWSVVIAVCYVIVIFNLLIINGSSMAGPEGDAELTASDHPQLFLGG